MAPTAGLGLLRGLHRFAHFGADAALVGIATTAHETVAAGLAHAVPFGLSS